MLAPHIVTTLLMLGVVLGSATIARAARAQAGDGGQVRSAVANGKILALPRILAVAQQRVPGEVLKVELRDIEERPGYEVKILTPDGRVREIGLDARTGTILKIQDD